MRPASRRGGALLIALALLALGTALLAGASAASRAVTRAQVTLEAVLAAESEARVAVAERVAGWGSADDSMPVGSSAVRALSARANGFGSAVTRSVVRVQRLDSLRYVVVAVTRVGPDSAPRAERRASLLLERRTPDSTGALAPPVPVGRWGMTALF